MNNGEDRRGCEDRHVLAASFQQNAQDDPAKECFFNERNRYRRRDHLAKARPGKGVPKRVNVKCDEQSATAEQGNGREKNTREDIAAPAGITRKAQIGHASHAGHAKERPE